MEEAEPTKGPCATNRSTGKVICNDTDILSRLLCGESTAHRDECQLNARLQPRVMLNRIKPPTYVRTSSAAVTTAAQAESSTVLQTAGDNLPSTSWQAAEQLGSAHLSAAATASGSAEDSRLQRRANSSRRQFSWLSKDYVCDTEELDSILSETEANQSSKQPNSGGSRISDDLAVGRGKRKSSLTSLGSRGSASAESLSHSSEFRGQGRIRGRGCRGGRAGRRGRGRGGRGGRGGPCYIPTTREPQQAQEPLDENMYSSLSNSPELARVTMEHFRSTRLGFSGFSSDNADSQSAPTALANQSATGFTLCEERLATNIASPEKVVRTPIQTTSAMPLTAAEKMPGDARDQVGPGTSTQDQMDNGSGADGTVEDAQSDAADEPLALLESCESRGVNGAHCIEGCICQCLVGLAAPRRPRRCNCAARCVECHCTDKINVIASSKTGKMENAFDDDMEDYGHNTYNEAHSARTSGPAALWRSHKEVLSLWSNGCCTVQNEKDDVLVCSKTRFTAPLYPRGKASNTGAATATQWMEPSYITNDSGDDDDDDVLVVSESPAPAKIATHNYDTLFLEEGLRSSQTTLAQSAPAIAKRLQQLPPLKPKPLPLQPSHTPTLSSDSATFHNAVLSAPPIVMTELGGAGAASTERSSQPTQVGPRRGAAVASRGRAQLANQPERLQHYVAEERLQELSRCPVDVDVKAVNESDSTLFESLAALGSVSPGTTNKQQTFQETWDTNERLKVAAAQTGNGPPVNVTGSRITVLMLNSRSLPLQNYSQLRIICPNNKWTQHEEIRTRILSLAVQLADDEPTNTIQLDFDDAAVYIYPKKSVSSHTGARLTAVELAQEPRYMLITYKAGLLGDRMERPPNVSPTAFLRQNPTSHRRPLGQYRDPEGPLVRWRHRNYCSRSTPTAPEASDLPAACSAPTGVSHSVSTQPTSISAVHHLESSTSSIVTGNLPPSNVQVVASSAANHQPAHHAGNLGQDGRTPSVNMINSSSVRNMPTHFKDTRMSPAFAAPAKSPSSVSSPRTSPFNYAPSQTVSNIEGPCTQSAAEQVPFHSNMRPPVPLPQFTQSLPVTQQQSGSTGIFSGQVRLNASKSIAETTGLSSGSRSDVAVPSSNPVHSEVASQTFHSRNAMHERVAPTEPISSACTMSAESTVVPTRDSSESSLLPATSGVQIKSEPSEPPLALPVGQAGSEPAAPIVCHSIHPAFEGAVKVEPGFFDFPHLYGHPDMVEPGVLMSVDIEDPYVDVMGHVGHVADVSLQTMDAGQLASEECGLRTVSVSRKSSEALIANDVAERNCLMPPSSSSGCCNSAASVSAADAAAAAESDCSKNLSPGEASLAVGLGCTRAFQESAVVPPSSETSAVSAYSMTSLASDNNGPASLRRKQSLQSYLTFDDLAEFRLNPAGTTAASTSTAMSSSKENDSFVSSPSSSSAVHGRTSECPVNYSREAFETDVPFGDEYDCDTDETSPNANALRKRHTASKQKGRGSLRGKRTLHQAQSAAVNSRIKESELEVEKAKEAARNEKLRRDVARLTEEISFEADQDAC